MPHRSDQVHTTWHEAADLILAAVQSLDRSGADLDPILVGITGPAGSGKSTLAARLGGVCIATDHYLPDYEGLPESERDEPRHAALDLLASHLGALARREPVEIPVWNFHSHRRVGLQRIDPAPLVICEGLFALTSPVRSALHLAVFVDAPAALRLARWERMEQAGLRGWGVEAARSYFTRVADPTFHRFALEYRAAAQVIVVNDSAVECADSADRPREQA